MPVNIIDTIKPKNGLNFPVVEAIDVSVEDYENLADAISHFATDVMIEAINAVLSDKANTSDVNTAVANLQGQINQIVISASAESVVAPEVAAARVAEDGTSYQTLKERLDYQHNALTNNVLSLSATTGLSLITGWSDADKYIITNGNVGTTVDVNTEYTLSGSNIRYTIVECSKGDKFIINGTGGTSGRLWCFTDSEYKLISKATSSDSESNLVLVAPTDSAYLILHDTTGQASYSGVGIKDYVDDKFALKEDLIDLQASLSSDLSAIDDELSDVSANISKYNNDLYDGESRTQAWSNRSTTYWVSESALVKDTAYTLTLVPDESFTYSSTIRLGTDASGSAMLQTISNSEINFVEGEAYTITFTAEYDGLDSLYIYNDARKFESVGFTYIELVPKTNGIQSELTNVKAKSDSYIKGTTRKVVDSAEVDFVNENKVVLSANGNLADMEGYSTSDYIELDNAVVYRIEASSKKTLPSFAYYDKDKVFISGQASTTNYEQTTYNGETVYNYDTEKPQNAKYIRLSKQESITSVSYHVDETENYYIFNGVTDDAANSQKAIVTFIDDDFRDDCLTNWEGIADATGIKPVFAVRTNKVGLTQTSPTWDDIDRTRHKGFEYMSHTHNHIYLTDETDETIIADFQASIAALDAHGCTSDVLVYPGGRINAHVKELTKQYFKCGVTVGYKIQTPPLDDYQINRISFVDSSDTETIIVDGQEYTVYRVLSLPELKAIVDDAIERGGWLIFMSHFRNTLTDGFYFNDTIKQRVIDLIKYIGSKNVHICTFSEGYEKMKNIVSCGILTDETHYIVDCNGRIYE